jgi:hypothetical protein
MKLVRLIKLCLNEKGKTVDTHMYKWQQTSAVPVPLCTINPTQTALGLNPGVRSEKPATNSPSY